MADLNKILRDAAGNRLNPRTIIGQVDNLPEKLAAIEAIVAPEFVTTNVYHIDDIVTHEDKLYKFTAEHTAGAWNPAHVSETTIVNELLEAGGLDLLADEYATASTYNKGDYTIYDRELYKCKTDNTTGAWDSTKWDKVTVADELQTAVTNVIYDGTTRKLQKTINGTTTDVFTADSGVTDGSNNLVTSDAVYEFGKQAINDNIATEYDSSNTYNTGDYVTYNMKTYRCLEDNVTGTWNSSKWSQIFISDVLKNQYIVDTDDSNKLYFVTQSVVDGHIVEHYEEVIN